jgi:hypothetical protein
MRRLLPKTPGGRVALAIVAFLAGLNLIVVAVDAIAPTPGGRSSSSFATAPRGLAAWAELARDAGREVRAIRRDPSRGSLPARGTVVVLDAPGLPEEDLLALRRFAERGGHVVAGGRRGDILADGLIEDRDAPDWRRKGTKAPRTLLPVEQTSGVEELRTAEEGGWTDPGPTLPVIGGSDDSLLLVAKVGRGRVTLLADSSPLQNRLLGKADNAALALALAEPGAPLSFLETPHGYGEARGLRALPSQVQWALVLLALAALLYMAARGRRMGAPETLARPLAPPRAEYVEALGTVLTRRPDPIGLGEQVRAAALERLRARDADAIRPAAAAAGLPEDEAEALTRPVQDAEGALAAGRALARLQERAAGPRGRID